MLPGMADTHPDTTPRAPEPTPAGASPGGAAVRPRLHLLRAGTFRDMHGRESSFSAADLAATAAAYDPARARAPLVVGHPRDNSPAFGWLAALEADGDDLYGIPEQVDPAFAEAVRSGRYPERSASLYPPDHPRNPVPGVWYLRHVGALGGMAPAVRGLRAADLGADPGAILTLTFAAGDPAAWPFDSPAAPSAEDPMATETDLAARTAALEERERAAAAQASALEATRADLARQEQALAARAAAAERAELTAFCETLASEARIRPADVPPLTAVLAALPPDPAADFAAPDDSAQTPAPAAAYLRRFLSTLPPLVELSEVATKDRAAGTKAPDDAAIVTRARVLHREAVAAGTPISFSEAVGRAEQETTK